MDADIIAEILSCISNMSRTGIASFKGQIKTQGRFNYMYADVNYVILSCMSYVSLNGIVSVKGHTKTLGQFTYMDADINDVILSCISNMTITGIVGSIAFGNGADPIKNIRLERIQGR